MELTIYAPGLLLPSVVLHDTVFDLAAPGLSSMLGRSEKAALPDDWLAHSFGIESPLPAAALRNVGAGGTANGDWLCLDPVHWSVSREGITLDDPLKLHLDNSESVALVESLSPLFAAWGKLGASSPAHWEIGLSRPLSLITRPLPEAIGQPVDPALPEGADGRAWRGLIAEAQTLLHGHPVNRSREARGLPVINSLWAWGQGILPQSAQTRFTTVWAGDPLLAGLCELAGVPCLNPPDSFLPASGNILALLDPLLPPARNLDALAWRAALLQFERDWIAPALAALKSGQCTQLRLIATGSGNSQRSLSFTMTRYSRLRFWRRPRPLTELQ